MILAGTSLLFHVCAKHGAIWDGVGAAWTLAAFLDTFIILYTVYCIFNSPV